MSNYFRKWVLQRKIVKVSKGFANEISSLNSSNKIYDIFIIKENNGKGKYL